ncbi:signal peptide peptidase-domain-containing protein [Tuber borchii]|uniref:Signal peptide peptidase-domain-containing protein n=1 Tax=Tuber borchii TaxID=42251 RepID=A0A2T6ZFP8_TUBBO|nr:signal peptide peptidase-domain-containing protein [Tuber borchii]
MPAGPLTHFIASALFYWGQALPFIPTYVHLITIALLPIVTGSFASLKRPGNAARPQSEDQNLDQDDEPPQVENLTASDALWFPVSAGLCLGSLYLIINYLDDPAIINKILTWYFCGMGTFAIAKGFSDSLGVLVTYLFPRRYRSKKDGKLYVAGYDSYKVKGDEGIKNENPSVFFIPQFMAKSMWSLRRALYARYTLVVGSPKGPPSFKATFWVGDLAGLMTGVLAVGTYALGGKHWLLTNIMGTSFAYGAMQLLSPTTFTTASILLGALFFYDIFFVFYTPMMVTVATTLDVPIKLLFPRPGTSSSGVPALAMLGLGDVVIPGLVIAMALRYDLWRSYEKKRLLNLANAEKEQQSTLVDDDGHDLKRRKKDLAAKTKDTYVKIAGNWGERYWTGDEDGAEFSKFYFYMSLGGYIVGMLTTLVIMHVFQHAQPALLYLVPGVLGSVWLGALIKGELRVMWNYTEEGEETHGPNAPIDGDSKESKPDMESTTKERKAGSSEEEASVELVEAVQDEEWMRITLTKRSTTLQSLAKSDSCSEDDSDSSSSGVSISTVSSLSEAES